MPSQKGKVAIVFLLLSLVSFRAADGATLAAKGTWERKLQRGFLNTAFSPLEISNELAKEKKEGKAFIGWFNGLARGSVFAVLRAFSGVYDVATFALPLPSGYEPIYQPEFSPEYLGLLKEAP
jgi:putative exosortase-associated protein (TIGR04073 family)